MEHKVIIMAGEMRFTNKGVKLACFIHAAVPFKDLVNRLIGLLKRMVGL